MASTQTDSHIVRPQGVHTHTVIMLHGRDSEAAEFADEFFESQASDERTLPQIFPGFKWVFPSSGTCLSERFDVQMSQWFDMWATENPNEKEDEFSKEGFDIAVPKILSILEEEAKIISPHNIFLGGISQGGAVAIHTLLRSEPPIAGFLGFCTWLPFQAEALKLLQHKQQAFKTPMFLAHAEDDEVIAITNGVKLCHTLQTSGLSVSLRRYEEGGHWFNEPQGIDDMVKFIRQCM
ncbi:unnamed protein product [Aureobasidium mustum]|uniref:Phospholipase/carboxylesterase/thioesterase domain-containing protein n=1 Tax=Aureobasidium mustum TaxID=2773714 RepID=A0A9N8PJQ7_9PEZI|nr:unnamed protein product [Aureobasidium mustum]